MRMVEYEIEDLGEDKQLVRAVNELFKPKDIFAVVESGTFHGTGTTKLIINAIEAANYITRPLLFTVEASENNYLIAKKNLKEYEWVQVIHGVSVDMQDALNFMEHDEPLNQHGFWPNIYIDDLNNPVAFYSQEVRGQLFGSGKVGENNVFARLLPAVRQSSILLVLDSCGGTGWFEFQKAIELMGDYPFCMLLDDVCHVKHFRSAAYIESKLDEGWSIIAKSDRWMLAGKNQCV